MIGTGKLNRHIALSGTSLAAAMLFAAGPVWAQNAGTSAPSGDTAAPADTALPQSAAETVDETEAEIVVTGSSIRGVPPTGSNLISVSREDIRTIGANTTPDLLASVPQLMHAPPSSR